MIDYALIDATVNEWMHDLEHQQSLSEKKTALEAGTSSTAGTTATEGLDTQQGQSRSAGSLPITSQSIDSQPTAPRSSHTAGKRIQTSSPTRPDAKAAMRRVYKALRNTSGSSATGHVPMSQRASGKMDRVLARALKQQVLTEGEVKHWMGEHGRKDWPSWRTVCEWAPERAHTIERLAATVYGFRPVLICQMSTLVLADLLTMRIPEHLWRPMMENGVIPVVEHGHAPDPSNRVLCVSNDPSKRNVRAILDDIKAFSPELAYADVHHVRATMDLLAQHVPVIGAQVYTPRPALKRIDASVDTGKAA